MSARPPACTASRQTAAARAGLRKFRFDFNAGVSQTEPVPGQDFQPVWARHDCYPSLVFRSGRPAAGPAFLQSSRARASADGPVDRAELQSLGFSFSNIRVRSRVIKTINRGSNPCSRHQSSPRLWPRRCFPAVSARTATPPPTAQPSALLGAPQPAPSSLTPQAAAKPEARLLARSSAVCRAACPVCPPASDDNRSGGLQDHSRPSGVAPRMAFSFVGRQPCSRKS